MALRVSPLSRLDVPWSRLTPKRAGQSRASANPVEGPRPATKFSLHPGAAGGSHQARPTPRALGFGTLCKRIAQRLKNLVEGRGGDARGRNPQNSAPLSGLVTCTRRRRAQSEEDPCMRRSPRRAVGRESSSTSEGVSPSPRELLPSATRDASTNASAEELSFWRAGTGEIDR